ncbi:NAD(P)-binding protein [Pleurotus eryngii]|uniref:NAD(P)-binding protein n=1 Tax=Pleurotus eryngii TaxID=5323 RepID=A0A9P5ZIS5_PLEER|nr:NAD(P)-binding protein [Pleurotus eryngii]
MPIPTNVDYYIKRGIEVIEKTTVKLDDNPSHIIVEYCGVNFIDIYHRQGVFPLKGFPAVLGKEAAGTVVRLSSASGVMENEDYQKRGYKVGDIVTVDFVLAGAFATYVSLPFKTVYRVGSSVDSLTAAASLVQGLAARGDTILIHTVAGGLGLLFTRLAKHREKATLAKSHGADHVILYKSKDTVTRVVEITNGEGVNAIFDGLPLIAIVFRFDNNFKMIRGKGTIVVVGNASGLPAPFPVLKLIEEHHYSVTNVSVMNNYLFMLLETLNYGNMLFSLIAQGVIRLNVVKELPFTADGVKQVQEDLAGGITTRKLVIKVE